MDSLTKLTVTPNQLNLICQVHLGSPLSHSEELTDGWFNASHLLTTHNGTEAVIKIAPPSSVRVMRYEADLMRAEVEALRLVRLSTKVPIPDVLAYDADRAIVSSEFFITNRLHGRPLNHFRSELSEETQSHVDRQIGRCLAEFCQLKGSGFGTFNDCRHRSWFSAFDHLMQGLAQDAADFMIELPDGVFDWHFRYQSELNQIQNSTFVHWDLWDGNIFVDPETGNLEGLIDFERALWADPLMEANFMSPSRAFLGGYGGEPLKTAEEKVRRKIYDLYLFLIMVIECRFRHFKEDHEAMCRKSLDRAILALIEI